MEAVPSLCATGTVGVAAVGFAFGQPQHFMATRATASERRSLSREMIRVRLPRDQSPSTPSPLPPPASAPTSRLRKRQSTPWSTTSPRLSKGSSQTVEPTQDTMVGLGRVKDPVDGLGQQLPLRIGDQEPFTFDLKLPGDGESIQRRPRSTISSFRTRSPSRTSPPGSASMSQSNGSTAPILPIFGNNASPTTSRNRLVKRSSSQRALNGGSSLHSTLRRPATSHQRSATLQRHFFEGEEITHPTFYSSPLPNDISEQGHDFEGTAERWQPFFKARYSRAGRLESSRKRYLQDSATVRENTSTIVPDLTDLPTLLLSTSISTRMSDDATTARQSNPSRLSRPFSPVGLAKPELSTPYNKQHGSPPDFEERPRSSFSLSGIFPSPATWRMPRSGSVRGKQLVGRNAGGRRIVSAPQATKGREVSTLVQEDQALGNHTLIYASPDYDETPSRARLPLDHGRAQSPSSPLPPLERLSSFQVDLPDTIPSYPTSPDQEWMPRRKSRPYSRPSSPLDGSSPRSQPAKISDACSVDASTPPGSDHEHSRLLSGDEDDMDGRSSTAYDSTRTGATGSSLSGTKRPHIDTIFDESPPPEFAHDSKSFHLKNLRNLTSESEVDHVSRVPINPASTQHRPEGLSSSGGQRVHKQEELLGNEEADEVGWPGMRNGDQPPAPSSPATKSPTELLPSGQAKRKVQDATGSYSDGGQSSPSVIASKEELRSRKSAPRRRDSPPLNTARQSISEWSEQSPIDRDSPQAEGGRPKTVHGRQSKDPKGNRLNGRRGPTPLHMRSQSVPVPNESRSHANSSILDSWTLGNKGPSEDWDGDFEFEEPVRASKPISEGMRSSLSSGMLVPRAILERQASVHGQFGQVKELTILVEELKRLQQLAKLQGIIKGQAAELWKEAEGIINLATLDDDEQNLAAPHSPVADFEFFDEESPSNRRRRSDNIVPKDERSEGLVPVQDVSSHRSPHPSTEILNPETPHSNTRSRKDSSAKAKSVLETIDQQRFYYDPALLDAKITQKKLPFDTTSLKDLVTRAGVVTRALKEELRRAEARSESPAPPPDHDHSLDTPPDPPWTKRLHKPSPSPSFSKSPRIPQSPKSSKGSRSSMLGANIAGNDNDFNGHLKMMTVV